MTLCFVIAAAGLAALIWYVKEKLAGFTVKELMLKTLVSCLFIGTALAAQAVSGSRFGYFVLFGLVCGLMGDVWLDLKFVYPDDNDIYSFAGFKSFLIGHIFYIGGEIYLYADFSKPLYLIVPVILSVAVGFAVVLLAPVMKLEYGKFKKISMIYAMFLFGTVFFSGSLALMYGFSDTALNLMFIGGILFAASDLVLSGTYFGTGKDRPVDIILNYATYYPAQFVIAFSLLFAK